LSASARYRRSSASTCPSSASSGPSLTITSSAIASRCARVACAAIMRSASVASMPSRSSSRACCTAAGTSTTRIRSSHGYAARPPPSASSGIAAIAYAPGASAQAARSAARTRGWMIASSRSRASSSSKIRRRIAARSSAPSAASTSAPNAATTSASPSDPTATASRAATSASATATPRASNRAATALLPEATPPVRPMMKSLMAGLWRSLQRPPQHRRKAPAGDRLEHRSVLPSRDRSERCRALPFKGRVGWGWLSPPSQQHPPTSIRKLQAAVSKGSRLPPLLQKQGRFVTQPVPDRHPREKPALEGLLIGGGDPVTLPRALRKDRGRATKARG